MEHATVSAYVLPGLATLERTSLRGAPTAVRMHGECLNTDGDWECERQPSSRDDAFLARTRWSSPEAAYEVWRRAAERANFQEHAGLKPPASVEYTS